VREREMCFDDNENSKVGGEGGGGRLHAVDVVDDAHAEERVVEDVSHLRVRDTTPHRTSQHAPASQPSAGGRAHEQAVLAHAVPDRGLAERPRRDLRSKIRRVRARRETRSPGAPPIPALAPPIRARALARALARAAAAQAAAVQAAVAKVVAHESLGQVGAGTRIPPQRDWRP